MGEEMRSGYAAAGGENQMFRRLTKAGPGILEQVSAIERRNALTFQPSQLSRQFERCVAGAGGVGIKIPYSQGTCENQLDFEQQFSPLPPQKQQQLLFAWQHPTAAKSSKNDPFKGRLARTLLLLS